MFNNEFTPKVKNKIEILDCLTKEFQECPFEALLA
jgi:hypothetical protein